MYVCITMYYNVMCRDEDPDPVIFGPPDPDPVILLNGSGSYGFINLFLS